MKNLTTLILFTILTATTVFATTTPTVEIINSSEITVTAFSKDFFEDALFNTKNETLEFTTLNDISVVQIFDADGNLEFQLPVMSKVVHINKNLLSDGKQKLGFIMHGVSQVHFTEVNIK